MGKHKVKQATAINTDQIEHYSNGLEHSKHSERCSSSGTRPIIYKFEALASTPNNPGHIISSTKDGGRENHSKLGGGHNSSRRSSQKSSSQKRSKSLSSMRQRSRAQKEDTQQNPPTANTVTERSRPKFQRTASIDKPDYYPLKPILKRKPELPEVWVKREQIQGNQHNRVPSRNVSITSMEEDKDVRVKRKDSHKSLDRSHRKDASNTAQTKSKTFYREVNTRALVHTDVESPRINSPKGNNDIHNITTSGNATSTHIIQTQPDANESFNGMNNRHCHKHQYASLTGDYLDVKTPSSWKSESSANDHLSVKCKPHNDYREIWIGNLVEKKPGIAGITNTLDISYPWKVPALPGLQERPPSIDLPTIDDKEGHDLIDLSIELPPLTTHSKGTTVLPTLHQQSDKDMVPTEYDTTTLMLPSDSGGSIIGELLGGQSLNFGNDSVFSDTIADRPSNPEVDIQSPDVAQAHNSDTQTLECKMGMLSDVNIQRDCNTGLNNNNSNGQSTGLCSEAKPEFDFDKVNPSTDNNREVNQSDIQQPANIPRRDIGKSVEGEKELFEMLIANGQQSNGNSENSGQAFEQLSDQVLNFANVLDDGLDSNHDDGYQPIVLPPPCLFGDPIAESVSVVSHDTEFSEMSINVLSDSMNACVNTATDKKAEDLEPNSNHSSTDLSSMLPSECNQENASIQTALQRVMQDVKTAVYWNISDHSGEGYSDSDSLQSGTLSPRSLNQLKTTVYDGKLSESESTASSERMESEDSNGSKRRVTIVTTSGLSRRRHSEKISFNHSKGILKKPLKAPVFDTLPSSGRIKGANDEDESLMKRSFSTSYIDEEAPQLRVASQWYVLPPTTVPNTDTSEKTRIDYLDLPRLQLPKRPQKPMSRSLELVGDAAGHYISGFDIDNERHTPNSHSNKIQSLPHGITSRSSASRKGSRFNKMFSRNRSKSMKASTSATDQSGRDVTVSTLYSEWLDDSAEKLPIRRRGEGLRTVVLARTKKGYGFVLRGAKAEQLRKLNVQFVPSEKMPALQYLDSVEKGSVSDKAGLKAGDFILEIDGINVVHASHEQTVQIIKKAGDVLAMKVVRAVLTMENGGKAIPNGAMNGSLTLPHRKPFKDDPAAGSASDVLARKHTPESSNGQVTAEEKLAIDQLDATLANYDSDSRSSGSGAVPPVVTFREPKTASIRQRPSSSHFNSIQELDDMFSAPAPAQPSVPPSLPAAPDKNDTRKPAKSRVKKFWNKGKTNNKLSSNTKQLSLSQPNLASLDRDAEVQPITMYEMSVGHSIDAEGHMMTSVPRTFSGDLSTLRRKTETMGGGSASIVTTPLPPPPPSFPAPVPDDDRSSQISSNSTGSKSASSFGLHSTQTTLLRNQQQDGNKIDSQRFLPRTPFPPTESSFQLNNSSPNSRPQSISDGGTLQRGKVPPPPPLRSCSHDSGVILAMQGHTAPLSNGSPPAPPTQYPVLSQSNSFTKQSPTNQVLTSSSFSDAIKKAAAEREITDKSANNNSVSMTTSGNDIYAVIQKKPAKNGKEDPPKGGVVSVEDQLRLAVAKRRTLIDRQEPSTESDRSHSATPEKTLSSSAGELELAKKTENTNFRELAEQKRLEFLKKKADSRDKLLPPPTSLKLTTDDSTDESLSELKKVMSRLSVVKADEPNNNIKKKPPPVTMKKPGKAAPQANTHDHLSPVEEFPPPPPPHDFGSNGTADIIIPPPSFEVASQPVYSPQSLSPTAYTNSKPVDTHHPHHDADSHSVTSSAGSDTISSVSQDGNRLSVATSGYSSDPSRSTKLSFSGKNVELWSIDEVGEWLDAIGLGEYKGTFAENCIEGETLISMSKSDVKELGVEKVGHRVKLDKEIRKLVAESNS